MPEFYLTCLQAIGCFVLGCAVGYLELFKRFDDEPSSIHKSSIAYLYIATNGISSLIALCLLKAYNGEVLKEPFDNLQIVMISGISGLLVLRSSFFTYRNGNQEIPIGPAALLTIFLNGIDRLYDRERANDRANKIGLIMRDIVFEKAEIDLSVACLSLMQGLSIEEQEKMKAEVQAVSQAENEFGVAKTKSVLLGLILVKYTGFKTLQQAIEMLGDEIKHPSDSVNILDNFLDSKVKELGED